MAHKVYLIRLQCSLEWQAQIRKCSVFDITSNKILVWNAFQMADLWGKSGSIAEVKMFNSPPWKGSVFGSRARISINESMQYCANKKHSFYLSVSQLFYSIAPFPLSTHRFRPPSLIKQTQGSKFKEFYLKKVSNSWTKPLNSWIRQFYYDANITYRILVKIIHTSAGHTDGSEQNFNG